LQTARKKMKRGYAPKPVRRRDWLPDAPEAWDEWDEMDIATQERVMPLDERERRRTLEQALFAQPGTDPVAAAAALANSGQPDESPLAAMDTAGTVLEISNGLAQVELGERVVRCTIRGALNGQRSLYTNPVTVGDQVVVYVDSTGDDEQGVIQEVLPRRTVLARPDVHASHLQQALVANADQLLIVASWREPALWPELLDRYLVAAERFRLAPVICVNKIDLAEDVAECHGLLSPYRILRYPVVLTSAVSGAGLDALGMLMESRTTVLSGLSGVGKSTLLTAIYPSLDLRTGETSERKHEGKHTTTQATFLRVDPRTAVVDTPGIRSLGLAGLRPEELAAYFPEIGDLALGCRFSDCSHRHEPGCAVQSALETGLIAPSRYHSYAKIYEEISS